MPKVIDSLELQISHQMRSYSCQDHLMIELYLLFWMVGHYCNLGEKGPNTPKSSTKSHKKKLKVFNSLFHIKLDLTLVLGPSVGQAVYTCLTGTRVLGPFGEIGPKYPKSCPGTHEK